MDVVKAREILGGHTCVLAYGPLSLKLGSLRETEAYYKHLFDISGKGGGLILSVRVPDRGKTEDAKAMLDSIRDYCRY